MKKEFGFTYESIKDYEHLNDIEKQLFNAAKAIREQAYAVYSNFNVGCALLLENGQIITGSNQENAAYPSGLCAERTTIFWASANFPKENFKKLFVIGAPKNAITSEPIPPCGACRQAILEYETKQNQNIEIYFASLDGEILKTNSIKDLLPFSFDASFL